jgi:hypothetical protein
MQDEFDRRWKKLAQEVLSGMRDWRVQHATATFAEIEEELDKRMCDLNRYMAILGAISFRNETAYIPS